jgi:hypothetical protein
VVPALTAMVNAAKELRVELQRECTIESQNPKIRRLVPDTFLKLNPPYC